MENRQLVFRDHAIRRMAQRGISEVEIRVALVAGETIEDYPDGRPYPSRLVLGWVGGRPLHLVLADNPGNMDTYVITAYEPDPNLWEGDFCRRKQL